MNTCRHLALFCFLFAATSAWATFESVKVEATELPFVPASLRINGFRSGEVVVALRVLADGQLGEHLVLAATHRALIKPCLEALPKWRYTPARQDGQPVLAQLQVRIKFEQEGVIVVNRTVSDVITAKIEAIAGRPYDLAICPAAELDRPVEAITTVAPRYALEAEQDGVRGRVQVEFYIDENGDVRMPAVAPDTHPYLSTVAVEALRDWKFEPPTRGGRPVQVAAVQEFVFDAPPGK